jgi:4-hydroxythreonine-4-phosphate dehydrogenase
MSNKPRIGITLGDVNGIGPELIIKVFQDQRLKDLCTPILYGSSRAVNIYRKIMNVEKFHYQVIPNATQAQSKRLNIIECMADLERVDIGKASEIGGRAAHTALRRAIDDALHRELDALVTLPVDKASLQQIDPEFIGHTELLARAFNVDDSLMLMADDELRVGLVTNHLPLREVADALSVDKIVQKALMLNESLEMDFGIRRPLIAILALNPHAGDRGLLGNEEEMIVQAVEELKSQDIMAMGPYPADGYFGSLTYKKFHATLAMYHDQGLIPFKLLAGYNGVNFTAGLPIVRTSPDHGVAYDIAGKDLADPTSFRQALFMAIDLSKTRQENEELRAHSLDADESD